MPTKKSRRDQRQYFKKQVAKLQKLGLLGTIDLRKKASPQQIRQVERYRDLLVHKASAIRAKDEATAIALRKKFKLRGRGLTVVIPKEKREKFKITGDGKIVSTRPGYIAGETIKKEIGQFSFEKKLPGKNEKAYYTIPERTRGAGRLKRRTFASFDEMLYYLSKYEVEFEDIEDRIEVEYVERNSRKDKRISSALNKERAAAMKRRKRKKRRKQRRF